MTNGELIALLGGGCSVTSVVALYFWRAFAGLKQLSSDNNLRSSLNNNLKESFNILEAQLKRYQDINQELHDDILTLTAQRDRANNKVLQLEGDINALRQAYQSVRVQQEYLVSLINFLKNEDNRGRIPPLPTFFCPLETDDDPS